MKKQDTTNTFGEGLIMDLNPLVTPNNVVTNCLNGTLLTYNGNENVLQNDMGNGRVETAFLPEGYVPLGTAELGGIIYVVSYNPLIDKCQIGSFPSPERNITSDEFPTHRVTVTNEMFQEIAGSQTTGKITNTILKVKLLSDSSSEDGMFKLNPGDKYTIYSTNKGVTENATQISDVGNSIHIVDNDPRVVTIHVVSIGEDGKIVYLDDSLKWNGDTSQDNPQNYYIKECEIGESIKTDLDDYRSLVSSAYNIFNSKVSGELALLFELKIIDTFSVTWDADVEDIEDAEEGENNKKAKIYFNVNYTSSHPNINLSHVILSDSTFVGSESMDDTENPELEVGLHADFDIQDGSRQNDGTDDDLITTVSTFKYKSDGDLSDYIWNYALTPAMEFGYLDFLTQKGSINFLEIGSGKITLDEWRYFIQEDNFYLNWGLSAYPEKNKKIDKVTMTFIPFDMVNKSNIEALEEAFEESSEVDYAQYTITGKNSYSGYFQELIPFNTANTKITKELKQNFLYLVDVCIDYGSDREMEHRHNYKWLYTTRQWNNVFKLGEVQDFTEQLTLDDVLKFGPEFDVTDNITSQTAIHNSALNVPTTYEESDQPYVVAGAQITTVNYNTGGTFNTTSQSVEVAVETKCTSYPSLFKFEKQEEDNYIFSLEETSITHDDFVPKTDTRTSTLSSQVISKIKEQGTDNKITVATDLGSTINTIITEGIQSATIDNKAEDSFSTTLTPRSDGVSFDLNLRGAIFSRINADLAVKSVSVGQQIRPLLYEESDYAELGMTKTPAFAVTYNEYHHDLGGGKPFSFEFWTTEGTFKCVSKGGNAGTNEVKWDPGDDWTRQNWWDDIPPYNQGLNPSMLGENGSFQIMHLSSNSAGVQYGGVNIKGSNILWARTTEGHYVPIKCTGTSSYLAGLVSQLYAQLYYVDTDAITKQLPVVINIVYLSNYTETWNVKVGTKLTITDILDNVQLISSTAPMSLRTLLENCNDIDVNTSNITRSALSDLDLGDKLISHSFYIQNIDLYNQYDDQKSVTIPAIALLSTEDSWQRCSPKTQNILYVRDKSVTDGVDFVKLRSDTAQNLTYGGSITSDSQGRLKLNPGTTIPSNANRKIYDCFQFNNGVITLLQTQLLASKSSMRFQSNASGNPWSTVYNNSGYSLV